MSAVVVHFKRGKPWAFEWDANLEAWTYRTKKGNVYRLFMDNDKNGADVWIGRFASLDWSGVWHTCEARLGATHIVMFKGVFYFNQRPTKREGALLSALEALQDDHVQNNKHRMGLLGSQDIDRAVKLLKGEVTEWLTNAK